MTEREQQRRSHHAVLLELARLDPGDLDGALMKITSAAARTLVCARVGIWLFDGSSDALRCECLYKLAEDSHEAGQRLAAADFPRYFEALGQSRLIASDDARSDPHFAEFVDSYLIPFEVTSLLDVPIFVEGRVAGVLCCEHVGPARAWTQEEQELGTSLADTVSLAVGGHAWRRATAALEDSEERYFLAVRGANDGLWDWNLGSNVMFYSPRWKGQLGCDEDVIGTGPEEWFGRVHPEHRERLRAEIAAHLDGHTDHFEYEHRVLHEDGGYRWMLARGLAVRDAAGRAYRMAGSQTDITERRRSEDERERLYQLALAADRRKDEFLAVVSHELRTPLTSILGWSGMLRTGKLNPATIQRAYESIDRNARAQARIIDDLLDISRIIMGKVRLDARPLELAKILDSAVDSLRVAAGAKTIEVSLRVEAPEAKVFGDADRLQQIMWNLIANAIKFTPTGGRVEVRLDKSGDDCVVTVADTGSGIAPDFLPYVFDRFRQAENPTTRSHGGLGLGLAITKHLVELHGGTVCAMSDGLGHGSQFVISMPLAVDQREGAVVVARRGVQVMERPTALGGVKVLVVEDEADTREWVTAVLKRYGAKVVSAESAAAALRSLKSFWPNVLVSDIAMPEEDGYSLIRKVRSLEQLFGRELPAVALTALAGSRDRKQALSAGFREHLAKPIEPAQLAGIVARLAGRPWTDAPKG